MLAVVLRFLIRPGRRLVNVPGPGTPVADNQQVTK